MSNKSKSGKVALLFNQVKGALVEGDGVTPLSDNAWYLIAAKADSGSELPLEVGYRFKTPDSGNAITPATGDKVFPLTLQKICKTDASVSTEKGTIDVTDDCEFGYNAMIPDGFTSISGDSGGFMKFSDIDGNPADAQLEYWKRFFDVVEDDGAGTYSLTAKNDTDILIAMLQNSDQVTVNGSAIPTMTQAWLTVPAIVTSLTIDKPLKGPQGFNFAWEKAQGPASLYLRVTNSEEEVF